MVSGSLEEHHRKVEAVVDLIRKSANDKPWIVHTRLGSGLATSLYHALGGCGNVLYVGANDTLPLGSMRTFTRILIDRRREDLQPALEAVLVDGLLQWCKVVFLVVDTADYNPTQVGPCLVNKCNIACP